MTSCVTVVIPSFNQGAYLETTLQSIFDQQVNCQVIVVDGGSTDQSLKIIEKFQHQLHWWRSSPDAGQAAAINEGVQQGDAPFVCWLNSDDIFLQGGLEHLLATLQEATAYSAVYGKCKIIDQNGTWKKNYWTVPFSAHHLSNRCFIAQPATLIRRQTWEELGGLDESLHMAFDYDLWWRIYQQGAGLKYTFQTVAASRNHRATKTNLWRRRHYLESMRIVQKYHGHTPAKWFLAWPVRVTMWGVWNKLQSILRR